MNKKLIAAAIAAVVAAPAAVAADTTLYGKVWMGVAHNDNGTAGDNWTVDDGAGKSRLGVKGSEDLGNGLKAIFKYETAVNVADGGAKGGTFGSARNAYLGLAGGFGTLLAGRHDTPAKVAYYSVKNDVMDGTINDFNAIAGTVKPAGATLKTFTEFRLDNAIAYVSPNFSGFTVAAATVPGEGTGSATSPATGLADAYSLGLMYAGGGLKASVGYEVAKRSFLVTKNFNPGATADHKMWQLGASYTFGDFMVGGNYEKDSDYAGAKGVNRTAWGLVGKANFGNNYVTANYGKTDGDTGVLLPNADGYGLALGHKFSKRTQVYAAYHATDYKARGMGDTSSYALGMIHTF